VPRPLTHELEEAGKRLAGIVNLFIASRDPWELQQCVLAVSLADGSTNGDVYDSQYDAVRHSDPTRSFYFHFKGNIGGIDPREAAIVIQFHREAREAGIPQADPDAGKRQAQPVPILSTYGHDVYSRIQRRAAAN
jgi:hypothetical protein